MCSDHLAVQTEETMRNDKTPPVGWTIEHRDGYAVLRHPNTMGGCVTIDWSCRGFRGGYSTDGRLTSSKTYRGRGWREELVRDAVAWLSSVYEHLRASCQPVPVEPVLIFLFIGAMVVALTLAPLGELLRHGEACPRLMKCSAALLPRCTSAWRAAMCARHYQANSTSKGKRCGGARACR